jgi:hypothetical protein
MIFRCSISVAVLTTLLTAYAPRASAQFGVVARDANDAPAFEQTFRKLLTAELHFVRKVCQPTDDQFNQIHRAGLGAIAALNINRVGVAIPDTRGSTNSLTKVDPNDAIAAALANTIKQVMSEEVWSRYTQEIQARAELRRRASAAMIVQMIDREAVLSGEQFELLEASILEHWSPETSDAYTVMAYPMYATLPDASVLRSHLSSLQHRLWAYRPNFRNVSLPWTMQLGLNEFLGAELEPFPVPRVEPTQESANSGASK